MSNVTLPDGRDARRTVKEETGRSARRGSASSTAANNVGLPAGITMISPTFILNVSDAVWPSASVAV